MDISQRKLNKLMAASNIIEKGDTAVIEKLLEFMDLIEDVSEARTTEVESMNEMVTKFESIKSECEEYMSTMDSSMSSHKDELMSALNEVQSMLETKLSTMEKTYKGQLDTVDKRLTGEINAVKASIPSPQDMTAYTAELDQIKASIPTMPVIPPSDTPEQVRDKLETLKGDDRLDKSAIRGLDEELKSIKSIKGTTSGGMFGMKQMRMVSFSFTGNDSDTVFYLPKEPGAKGYAIWAYYQGQHLQLGTHFTVANKTFTCVGFTPQTGSVIEGFIII